MFDKVVARAEDASVVTSINQDIYLVRKDGTVVPVATATYTIQTAQVVKVGTDYYIAAYDWNKQTGDSAKYNLYYAKVDSSNNVTSKKILTDTQPVYDLDSLGNLYYSDGNDTHIVATDGTETTYKDGSSSIASTAITPLANAVLAKVGNTYYVLKSNNTLYKVPSTLSTDQLSAISTCLDTSATVVGKTTNTLMCTTGSNFAYLTYNSTNDKFDGSIYIATVKDSKGNNLTYAKSTQNSMIFVNDSTYKDLSICTATGCSPQSTTQSFKKDLIIKTANNESYKSFPDYYLKAAYANGGAPYIVDLGQGTENTSILNIKFTSAATRGNVSLGLDKVANVYSPLNPQCPTTTTPKLYDTVKYKDATNEITIKNRPQDTCLVRVLQVR
jgi:hypothetical protein